MSNDRPRSSRQRYRGFVEDYRHHRLDDATDGKKPMIAGGDTKAASPPESSSKKHRKYVGDYLRWLRPHRYAVAGVFTLALVVAGLQMIEPLFMRFIIDHVLLAKLDAAARIARLNLAGVTFLVVVIISNGVNTFKDYRQRLLNVRLMLT